MELTQCLNNSKTNMKFQFFSRAVMKTIFKQKKIPLMNEQAKYAPAPKYVNFGTMYIIPA